ncbi:MAG: hypothetical protein KDB65_11140 [Calditrichaeota bacterium]|nr:hypothetical protein [Calditrichota bacterium]MCB9369580.1 hypothetical protein [Calditrichota bacterium]
MAIVPFSRLLIARAEKSHSRAQVPMSYELSWTATESFAAGANLVHHFGNFLETASSLSFLAKQTAAPSTHAKTHAAQF